MLDPYTPLGLDSSATADDIRAAYRRRAAQVHPDHQPAEKCASADEEMKRLNEARDLLLDPWRRAVHDQRFQKRSAPQWEAGPRRPGVYSDLYVYPRRRSAFRLLWPWNLLALFSALLLFGVVGMAAPGAVRMLVQTAGFVRGFLVFLASIFAITVLPALVSVVFAFAVYVAVISQRSR